MNKKILSVLVSLVMSVAMLAGCSSGPVSAEKDDADISEVTEDDTSVDDIDVEEKDVEEKDSYVFGYTCMDGTNPFFVILEQTIRDQVEANGDKLISTDPANDVTLQITQIEDMISQGIDAIFLNPAEAEGVLPALDQLQEAGIPIINFDAEVAELEYVASYTGSDNYNAGRVCGEDLAKKVPEGGDIIVLDAPTINSIVDRTSGFLDGLEGKGFNIVAQQDAKGNLEVSMGIAEDLLQTHSDVVAIFGGNDPTALGALAAANAAGLEDVKIYGVDGSPDIKAEIASGNSLIEGTGAQSPINIAQKSVVIMYNLLAGEEVNARYPVETFLITSENIDEFGADGWQ